MAARTTVPVPDLGDFKNVDVVDVLVRVGDQIGIDTPLITLETDKATMDVPSTAAGRVTAVLVKKGDKVSAGGPVIEVEPTAAETEPTVRQPVLETREALPPAPPPAPPREQAPVPSPSARPVPT